MRTDRGWKRFFAAGWFLSAVTGVAAIHQWNQHVRAVEDKLAESERTREAIAERVAAEERLRIARELHDSLTHSISVVKVQSGVAAHLARKRGEDVSEALLAIQEAAGDAARELRETLAVLRCEGEDAPGPGLADVPALIDRAALAGLEATLTVSGHPREVPAEVDGAAYRIIQEALTNVSRHAGPTTATVRVAYEPEQVVVAVEDRGLGVRGRGSGSGLGLIGMRERTSALGGRLVAQGRPGGGFLVRAELPAVQAVAAAS